MSGVRPSEQTSGGRREPEARRGDGVAMCSAVTDDGRAPRAALGLTLKARLAAVRARYEAFDPSSKLFG